MASLFVKIDVKDYIPSEMADFANALVDPIAHLSKVSSSVVSFIITSSSDIFFNLIALKK